MIDEKEVTAYVRMPACFMQGCSEDIVIFRADGGNHFTDSLIWTKGYEMHTQNRRFSKKFFKKIFCNKKAACFGWKQTA